MALKFGRSTPKTTDPQGNRIADPEVYGKRIIDNSATVSSWPEVRKIYQRKGLNDQEMMIYNPQVKAYLEGKTDKLSDIEFEEPILHDRALTNKKSLESNYKPGSKSYKAMMAKDPKLNAQLAKESAAYGGIPQFSSENSLAGWTAYGGGTTEDLNKYRTKAIKSTSAVTNNPNPVVREPEPTAESMDMSKLSLKPLKAGKLPMKGGKLKGGPAAPDEWSAPVLRERSKTKGTRLYQEKDGLRAGITNAATVGKSKPNKLQYNREAKTSAAYFGDNVLEGSVTGKNAAELKDMKKATKQTRNESLAGGSIKSAVALQKEVKQLRQAGEYAKKGGIAKQYGTGKIIEGQDSKLKYFTPELTKGVKNDRGIIERDPGAMAGYKEDKAYKKQQAFSSSMSNMANRNTVAKQQAALSGVDSYVASPMAQAKAAARTANPTMSNKEVRQNARSTRKEEIGIMKALDAKNKLKQ